MNVCWPSALLLALNTLMLIAPVEAQDVLIRGATVHTLEQPEPRVGTDVLLRHGKIAAIAAGLPAAQGVQVIEARGRALTPGIFGSLGALGLDDLTHSDATMSAQVSDGARLRPEFDATRAYNPNSVNIPIARIEGVTWTMLAPRAPGSFMAGQGAAFKLDGDVCCARPGSATLFLEIGSESASVFMLLEQAVAEARTFKRASEGQLLYPEGRKALSQYVHGGRVVVRVDRASDISRVVALSRQIGFRLVIAGGAEAWLVADELAAAKVPVVLDPLDNVPASPGRLNLCFDNAVLLQRAGVVIAFTVPDASNDARKIRQRAGNAVAQGLEWIDALAAITINPAKIFGLSEHTGSIAVGKAADLVLWSGDPLEVLSAADRVWIDGRAVPIVSRQMQLRDRYLCRRAGAGCSGGVEVFDRSQQQTIPTSNLSLDSSTQDRSQ